ncbi:hypothetical protein B7463_g7133, partial [Scytalidium lignicola]
MYLSFEERQEDGTCPDGTQFYTCASNGFKGCCGVDPCDLATCPASLLSALTVVATSSTSSTASSSPFSPSSQSSPPAVASTTSILPKSTPGFSATIVTTSQSSSSASIAATSEPSSSSSTTPTTAFIIKSTSSPLSSSTRPSTKSSGTARSTTTSPSPLTSTTSTTLTTSFPATAFRTDSASSTATAVPTTNHFSSKPPIIAGIVVGLVVLSVLSILIWFFCRKRRQNPNYRYSGAGWRRSLPGEIKIDNASSYDPRLSAGGDVFAPFGGWFRSPRASGRFSRHGEDSAPQQEAQAIRSHTHSGPQAMLIPNNRQDSSRLQVPGPQYIVSHIDLPRERQDMHISPMPEHDEEDAPIPDHEKSGLTPPDLSQHPVYTANRAATFENQSFYATEPIPLRPIFSGIPNNVYNTGVVIPRFASPVPGRAELPAAPITKAMHSQNHQNNKYPSAGVNRTTSRDTIGSTYTITVGLGSEDRNQNQPPPIGVMVQQMMRPNLRPAIEEEEEWDDVEGRRRHVMSWSTFDDARFTQGSAVAVGLGKEGDNDGTERKNRPERWSGSTATSEKRLLY